MIIRSFKDEDAMAICHLHIGAVLDLGGRSYTRDQAAFWAEESSPEFWRMEFAGSVINLVAEQDDTTIGFGHVLQSGELRGLYVHKDRQGEGIGSSLLRSLEQATLDKGIKDIFLQATENARGFYLHLGYELVRELQKSVMGKPFKTYIMTKPLDRA